MAKKQATYQHLHIGAGAFGLGFVIPLVAQAGFQTIVVNRARNSAAHARNLLIQRQQGYDLVSMGKNRKTAFVPISGFMFFDEDRERFLELVADPKTQLITTALRQGLLSFAATLADALAYRMMAGIKETLYLVACETPTIGDSFTLRAAILKHRPELATREFDRWIKFIPCIVDRICNEPVIHDATGRVRVEVEEFAEWLLEGPSPLENMLINANTEKHIQFVSNLAPFARRKTWLVNGPHLLVALRAFAQQMRRLDFFLATDEGRIVLSGIMSEAQRAFLETESFFNTMDVRRYVKKIKTRFSVFPDNTSRHLSRLSYGLMNNFIADLYKKCSTLQIPYAETSQRVPYQTTLTLFALTELIATGRYAYDDSGNIVPLAIDETE